MAICLFDIDGTMLSSGGAGQAAMEAALESAFGITAPTEGISVAGRTDRAITHDLMEYHSIDNSSENRTVFMNAYLSHLPDELASRDGLILPGVPELLDQMHQLDHVVLGLLTGNFRRGAELKLDHYKLSHYFCGGGFGDHHHDRDDVAREAIAEVRTSHGDGDDDVWVIGDTPADVKCGRAIGATVVAVATGLYSADQLEASEPDHLFENFSDVELVLGLLPDA